MAKVVCLTAMLSASAGWRNPKTRIPIVPYSIPSHAHPPRLPTFHTRRCRLISLKTHAASDKKQQQQQQQQQQIVQDEDEEEEEEMGWIQEKALDLVEFSGSVTQAIPGPRVAHTSLPWILAVPLAYLGLTFVLAFYKTLKKLSSPKAQRRRLVNKNVELIKSIDELFNSDREQLQHSVVQDLMNQTGFSAEDILRKYIRYALNEKPFNLDLVVDLIQLRKASMLSDTQVAETLNDISRRIVKDKGPVVMDASGYSEKGFKRKLAVQALFGKVLYLSELPEFCSRDNSLIVKEIFGVTDEDADKIRIQTLSDVEDMESLEKMVEGGSDSADNSES